MAEFMYGIRQSDGKIISIYDISADQVGLKCACKCPTCQVDFEACALNSEKVDRYFRHYSDKGSGGGAGSGCDAYSTNETALHLMAKEIIKEERMLFVPPQTVSLRKAELYNLPASIKTKIPQNYEYRKAEALACHSVGLEKPLPGFQPDVSVDTSRGEILVEIVVTNDIKPEKLERIKEYGAPTLKIDLSEFIEQPISRSKLQNIIVGGTVLKTWVYYPIPAEALKSARQYYESMPAVQQYLKENEKAIKEARLEAEKRVRREKKLSALLEPQNYNAELVRLRNDEDFLSYARKELAFYKTHQVKPFFIDIPITGEMIFQCDRRIWQGQIFDRFIYKRKEDGASFNVPDIFNKLKDDHKIPIDYDLTYKITVKNHLESEFRLRAEVVETYIKYLELLGFIAPKDSGGWYKQKGWKIVQARRTIIPPDKEAAELLFNALKKVDRRSPDIDMLLLGELSELHAERALQAEQARQEAAKAKWKAANALMLERREAAAALTAKRREEHRQRILNFDYNQSEVRIQDEQGYDMAKCTSCQQIVRANKLKRDWPNVNKGICFNCLRQGGK